MIEVGQPFSKPFQDLVDALVTSLKLGVEQEATQIVLFQENTLAYPLRGAASISRLAKQITGVAQGKPAVFSLGEHFVYNAGQLLWQDIPDIIEPEAEASWFPDPGSRLTVGFYYREPPSGITDFNDGSVAGTLVRAVSRELKLLYEQMDEAYRRAFIDYANGVALDNVVALLGIRRNQALPAQGEVTFSLKKPAKSDVPIAIGTRVADARGQLFKVSAGGVIKSTREETITPSGRALETSETIDNLVSVRVKGTTAELATEATAAGKPFGENERTITLVDAPPPGQLLVTYQPQTPKVTVPVVALEDGPQGNLGSGSLTVMPTPPRGVDGGVTNERPLTGGIAAEEDDALRERAKHELERSGNATLNAIRFAVLAIDGVDSVEVRDFSVDETIPLGEVWVRFSTGKSSLVAPLVSETVNKTRAAGIKAHVFEVSTVLISGSFFVIPDMDASTQAYANYKEEVIAQLNALAIGEPMSSRKLASSVFQVAGLADVAEMQLNFARGENPPAPIGSDPFMIESGEQARADEAAIDIIPVPSLVVTAAHLALDGTLTTAVSLHDDSDTAISFENFELALLATIRGKPAATPNQPLQQVEQVVGTVTFTSASSAAPVFPAANITNLDTLDQTSMEISIQAAAYPGMSAGTFELDVEGA